MFLLSIWSHPSGIVAVCSQTYFMCMEFCLHCAACLALHPSFSDSFACGFARLLAPFACLLDLHCLLGPNEDLEKHTSYILFSTFTSQKQGTKSVDLHRLCSLRKWRHGSLRLGRAPDLCSAPNSMLFLRQRPMKMATNYDKLWPWRWRLRFASIDSLTTLANSSQRDE